MEAALEAEKRCGNQGLTPCIGEDQAGTLLSNDGHSCFPGCLLVPEGLSNGVQPARPFRCSRYRMVSRDIWFLKMKMAMLQKKAFIPMEEVNRNELFTHLVFENRMFWFWLELNLCSTETKCSWTVFAFNSFVVRFVAEIPWGKKKRQRSRSPFWSNVCSWSKLNTDWLSSLAMSAYKRVNPWILGRSVKVVLGLIWLVDWLVLVVFRGLVGGKFGGWRCFCSLLKGLTVEVCDCGLEDAVGVLKNNVWTR